MAYVYKSESVAAPHSALARADFSRQRDTFVLASRYKNRDCQRLWNDFAAEQPAMARLIVKDVANEDRDRAKVNEKLDKRLVRAEKMVTKSAGLKVKKSKKPAKRRPLDDPELMAVLRIVDNARREYEYSELVKRRGSG